MAIITISGDPGSGKSTLARQLAELLKVPHFSGGDLYRKVAQEQGMDVNEFAAYAEEHPDVWDKMVDPYQAKLPEQHPSFVIDSRLGFHFIPQSIKIYLTCEDEEAALRILGDARTEEEAETVEECVARLRARRASEHRRYEELYGIDHHDPAHFDLVIDTTHLNAHEKLEKVKEFLTKRGVLS